MSEHGKAEMQTLDLAPVSPRPLGSLASKECVGVVFVCGRVAACSGRVKTSLPSSAKEKGRMIWGENKENTPHFRENLNLFAICLFDCLFIIN